MLRSFGQEVTKGHSDNILRENSILKKAVLIQNKKIEGLICNVDELEYLRNEN